jgi:hypothetical protein
MVKNTKGPQNIPDFHKTCQMAVKRIKWPKNVPTFSIPAQPRIYQNRDFWFASGNPG